MYKRKINLKKGLLKTSFIISITLLISFGIGLVTSSANSSADIKFIHVNVKHGDSLWLLADRFNNNHTDIRKLIYEIKKINNIGDVIYPGQIIEIPLYK